MRRRRAGAKQRWALQSLRVVYEGDYLCSDSELFYVECRSGDRVLIEDCGTGALIDVSVRDLGRLRRVQRDVIPGRT